MKLKFLADEDLRRAIVLGVRRREPSVSFIEAFEVGSNGKDDLTVLEIAARRAHFGVPRRKDDAWSFPYVYRTAGKCRPDLGPAKGRFRPGDR